MRQLGTRPSARDMTLVFPKLPPLQNPKGTPSPGALNTRMWEYFAIFGHLNLCLSRKQYEICPWLLRITNNKSYAADRSVSVPMTLSDLERRDARGQISVVDLR